MKKLLISLLICSFLLYNNSQNTTSNHYLTQNNSCEQEHLSEKIHPKIYQVPSDLIKGIGINIKASSEVGAIIASSLNQANVFLVTLWQHNLRTIIMASFFVLLLAILYFRKRLLLAFFKQNLKSQLRVLIKRLRHYFSQGNDPQIDEINKLMKNYDVIIDSNSMLKPWKILRNAQDQEMQNFLANEYAIVAAYGSINKGKTYILSKIFDREMPFAYNFSTPGICIMYPRNIKEWKGIKAILLDTAGVEQPIQMGNSEIMREMENAYDQDKYNQLLQQEFDDCTLTQDFNQKYICNVANTILLVVNKLTFADQKLVRHMTESNIGKEIIIVHNFKELAYIRDVEYQIQEDIVKCFGCQEKIMHVDNVPLKVYTQIRKNIKDQDQQQKKSEICVFHVVLGMENKESGNHYNELVFKYLRSKISINLNQTKFNLETSITNFRNQTKGDYYVNDNISFQIDGQAHCGSPHIDVKWKDDSGEVQQKNGMQEMQENKEIEQEKRQLKLVRPSLNEFGFVNAKQAMGNQWMMHPTFMSTMDKENKGILRITIYLYGVDPKNIKMGDIEIKVLQSSQNFLNKLMMYFQLRLKYQNPLYDSEQAGKSLFPEKVKDDQAHQREIQMTWKSDDFDYRCYQFAENSKVVTVENGKIIVEYQMFNSQSQNTS